MKVSVFGLGYIGTVSAACFADAGHDVIGVDIAPIKINMINSGLAPVAEAGLPELIAASVKSGGLRATADTMQAVVDSDISLLCVGTPSKSNGDMDTGSMEHTCRQIGKALAVKKDFHVVAVRSTILPGTMRNLVIPVLEEISGKKAGSDFGVCHNPEFLREGNAVDDFHNPARTVIGADDVRSADMIRKLYDSFAGSVIVCSMEVAELVKYADNAWHANKIAFANEIGKLCKSLRVDSHDVMDIFCRDTKLNLSAAYLKPGFAFGGSCLPKDLRAVNYRAQELEVNTPLLQSLLSSNEEQIQFGLEMILATGKKSIGLLGISFKAGTDDMRESALMLLARELIGRKMELKIYDSGVQLEKLNGGNREYSMNIIADIKRFMTDSMESLLAACDVIVIGNDAPEYRTLAGKLRPEQQVIDFVRIREVESTHANYQGICW